MFLRPTKLLTSSSINNQNWEGKKNRLKEKFLQLTDSDLDFEEGNVDEMVSNIHSKIGMAQGNTIEGLHKYIEKL